MRFASKRNHESPERLSEWFPQTKISGAKRQDLKSQSRVQLWSSFVRTFSKESPGNPGRWFSPDSKEKEEQIFIRPKEKTGRTVSRSPCLLWKVKK
jgi:hypothetical protein